MASVGAHIRSFLVESMVAVLAIATMAASVLFVARALGVFSGTALVVAAVTAFPFPVYVLLVKTLFPHRARHRSWHPLAYVALAQLLSGASASAMLDLAGECLSCRGNPHDIVLYALAAGTPFGIVYAFFSKMFSRDVDTPRHGL